MTFAEKESRRLAAEDPSRRHEFWDTQPVPRLGTDVAQYGEIATPSADDVRREPFPLPPGFGWCETDIDDPATLNEVYSLLSEHYVEDDDNMFRFNYSVPFLCWALKPPGYRREWHIGVRATSNGKLLAFITGVPATVAVHGRELTVAEINFLCVHKKLRSRRLTPVLIKEITRRVNLSGIFQAVYTSGSVLPKPVSRCRYYHRSLNPKKLIDVGFSSPAPRLTVNGTIKLYKLPEKPELAGIRPLQPADVPSACRLLNAHLARYELHAVFSETEFAHQFLPRTDIVACYVIAGGPNGDVSDMCAFYSLPSTIVNHPTHKTLRAAYSYYNVASTVPLEALVKDALIFAKSMDFDVFNCLDIMANESFLKELKFGKGDGTLQYYLFNWLCPEVQPTEIGLVLL
eukprot:TRINITY_DN364_c0_g1_i4.p1 TRINITY_DN364_c0_g1~~TRINITY_DN364_c0_g1_i4.p1  ORF type:complete len:402 (+),score=135.78 TRINITY_DN364_c0_g1_i4:175-1380(+)